MGKKRLVLTLDEAEHKMLVKEARDNNLTLSNYVRKALELPTVRQGVKPPEPARPKRAKNK